jgi:hypothetical protein
VPRDVRGPLKGTSEEALSAQNRAACWPRNAHGQALAQASEQETLSVQGRGRFVSDSRVSEIEKAGCFETALGYKRKGDLKASRLALERLA